jgi:5,10-methylenetetrahydromethanopterin reductase
MPDFEVGLSFRAESDPGRLAAIAEAVDGFTFDTLSVYDDLGDPAPFRTLAALAAANDTARIGPACIAVPRYASLESVVSEIAALEQARLGRVFLGLAPGAWLDELGLKRGSIQQMREALGVCRYLLDGRTDGLDGKTYRVRAGWRPSYALPKSRVPLMLGAWGEAMLAVGGELADEVKVGGSANHEVVDLVRRRLEPGLRVSGRAPEAVRIVLGAVTVVDEDGEAARRAARRRAITYIPVVGAGDPVAREQFGDELRHISEAVAQSDIEAAEAALPDELLLRFAFAGTPDEVVRQAERVFEAGAGRIEFGSPHGLEEAQGIELLGRKVLPYFG